MCVCVCEGGLVDFSAIQLMWLVKECVSEKLKPCDQFGISDYKTASVLITPMC